MNVRTQHFERGEVEFSVFRRPSRQPLFKRQKLPNGVTNRIQKQVQDAVSLAGKFHLFLDSNLPDFLK